jgi:hypothetical protein
VRHRERAECGRFPFEALPLFGRRRRLQHLDIGAQIRQLAPGALAPLLSRLQHAAEQSDEHLVRIISGGRVPTQTRQCAGKRQQVRHAPI